MPRKFFQLLVIFLAGTALSIPIKAQIVFRELPGYKIGAVDRAFFHETETRSIIPLNGEWTVYQAGDKDKKTVAINVPSLFDGTGDLVFEKRFTLSSGEIADHQLRLEFLGVNYSAEISVNNKIIYTHTGGEFPFGFDLPRDILDADSENVLSVKVHYKPDAENTIPLKQRFLFPKSYGGIFRDVYISLRPNISFTDVTISQNSTDRKAEIEFSSRVSNQEFHTPGDSSAEENQFNVTASVLNINDSVLSKTRAYKFELNRNKEISVKQQLEFRNPDLWTPESPNLYTVRIELRKDSTLVDVYQAPLALNSITAGKEKLELNGKDFELNGVTYIPSNGEYGNLFQYSNMERDLKMIRQLGFNAVRFAKNVPHPYYLYLCEKYGLLAFIEIPLNSIPEKLATDPNFITRSKNYLANFLKAYKSYPVAGVGLGGGYLPESEDHEAFLKNISGFVKENTGSLVYASFSDFNIKRLDNIDLYGVELLNKSIDSEENSLKVLQEKLGKGRVFISEATYIVNKGNSDGYVNAGSFEAQARYYQDLIDFAKNNPLAGYFINSMFDYRGEFASLITGYDKNNLYRLGICGSDRETDRLGYKVVFSKLHNAEKVTVPIGSASDKAPMVFILFGLLLAFIMGILVNSGRKFREDASRALLRPYNFYADVRDQRIISGAHSFVLSIVVAAVGALVAANFLSYLKTDLLADRLLLSFGSNSLIEGISYLAWHPVAALVWLTGGYFLVIGILTIIVKGAAFFVKNRVFLASVFYTIVWSSLPFVLLIPVGIVLYRILDINIVNTYIYWALILFMLWIFYRLMKGIYVIFDVNPGSVYFYSFIIIIAVCGGILAYYQINNSVINYIHLTLKQFHAGF